jgi:hypothetical protein
MKQKPEPPPPRLAPIIGKIGPRLAPDEADLIFHLERLRSRPFSAGEILFVIRQAREIGEL